MTKLTYLIGKMLARDVADEISLKIEEGFEEFELKARGKCISRAVDVLEIIKREHNISHEIETKTDVMYPEKLQFGKIMDGSERKSIKVSKIIIKVRKK